MNIGKAKPLMHVTILMVLLQAGRMAVRYLAFLVLERNEVSDILVSSLSMLLLAFAMLLISKKQNVALSVFPPKRKLLYTAATVILLFLLITSVIIQDNKSFVTIFAILYGSIFTPIGEELIFRGYMWNKLKEGFKNELSIYIITTLLFAVWHLGYVDVIAFKAGTENLLFVMMMKAFVGLCFGVVLGALRYKVKNCYATILLHGVMNIFGR